MSDATSTVLATFKDYIEAFNQKNAKALLPFYRFPCLIVNKKEQPKLILHSVLGLFGFAKAIKDLERQGFAYSKVEELSAKLLSENLAIISGMATRYQQDHSKLEDIGFTYTLHKTVKGWKIAVGVIHDPESYLTLPNS